MGISNADKDVPLPHLDSNASVVISVSEVPKPHIPDFKQYAYEQVKNTWSEKEWIAFDTIIKKESGWNNEAQNPNSTAFGYGQFLNSTWKLVGCTKTADANTQIDCTIKYINKVYGSPQKALNFHITTGWY